MSFGDVLNEWETLKRDERRRKEAGARPSGAGFPDGFSSYLDKHGTRDKDEGLDAEEMAARHEREAATRLLAMEPEASLDLHGLAEAEAMERLDDFLRRSAREGLRKVLVIHGKGKHSAGEAVLSRAVPRFLDRHPCAGRRGHPERDSGGKGATWVILKEGRGR